MAGQFRVSTEALNLRSAPGTDAEIRAVLGEGTLLTAASQAPVTLADGSTWLNVTIEGVAGWVHQGFVVAVERLSLLQRFRVATDALNLRSGPGVTFEILEVTREGDLLVATMDPGPAMTSAEGWLKVTSTAGTTGWVSSTFVTMVSAPEESAVSTNLAWSATVEPAFCERVRDVAHRLDCEPDFLMAAIAFETGRAFTADVRNPLSGATGLIQFMPSTAVSLGTTVEALAGMTAIEQLTYVERYLKPYQGRIHTIEDLYMAILWPAAIGKSNNFALFRRGTVQYTQNAGLDANGDGVVTKQEAARPVIDELAEGRLPGNRSRLE